MIYGEAADLLSIWEPAYIRLFQDAIAAGFLGGMWKPASVLAPVPPGQIPPWETPPQPEGEEPPLVRFHLIERASAALAARNVFTREDYDNLNSAARQAAFTVARVAETETLEKIRDALANDVKTGGTLEEFQAFMAETLEDTPLSPMHVETVYRTNIMEAYTQGMDLILDHPLVGSEFPFVRTVPIRDSRLTEICEICSKSGIDGTGIYWRADPEWQRIKPPRHYNCFLPGTKVQGRFQLGLKAWYSGEAVEVVTRSGNRLTVTGNHPVLSPDGFVPAKSLCEGQYVVGYRGGIKHGQSSCGLEKFFLQPPWPQQAGLACPGKNKQNGPALIEEVFESLALFGRLFGLPSCRDDFHGDAEFTDGYVDVVGTDSQLRLDNETHCLKRDSDLSLSTVGMAEAFVPGFGGLSQSFLGTGATPGSGMSGARLSFASGLIHAAPFQALRIGSAANLDASRYKPNGESAPINASFFRQLFHRHPVNVFQDQIIEVRHFEYQGHVYDLQSEGGWIIAENIFSSNCRCGIVPMPIEEAAKRGIRYAIEWERTGVQPPNPPYVARVPVELPPGFGRGL